jgi:hypothetical protein
VLIVDEDGGCVKIDEDRWQGTGIGSRRAAQRVVYERRAFGQSDPRPRTAELGVRREEEVSAD